MAEEIDLEETEGAKEVEEEAEKEVSVSSDSQTRNKVRSKRYELYEVEDDEVKRSKKSCPRCGPGVFMADHGERLACGKCGYTEFK
ncbi:MAG: 30S ribosomal protein S27ae [Candidatus Hadarchaeia archaeon]